MALTFADTHNMIAFLTKSDASEGFNQIIDFLNASSIKYALTVNANIYVSVIKQFWSSVAVKKVNDVLRLQALVNRKKVIITEATIRDALRLDDAEGIECLPNEEIFTELARMGYEKPSTKLTFYNAFFSSRKFNFSKYIFDILVRNVDIPTKFYMYPCFLQLMIKKQVGDLSSHTTKYSSPALTQKVFANMRRVGKGCSKVETPLFEGMIVTLQVGEGAAKVNVEDVSTADVAAEGAASVADDEVPAAVDEPSIPSPPPPTQPPPTSQDIPSTSQDKIAQSLEITKLKQRVKKLERRNKGSKLRRLQKGRIIADMDADKDVTMKDVAAAAKDVQDVEIEESSDVQERQAESQAQIYQIDHEHADKSATPSTIIHTEAKSKDKGKGIMIKEPKPLKKQAQIEQDEAYARELEAELKKNIDWDMGMTYDDIRPIFEKKFKSNVVFLQKTKEQMEEEDSRELKRLSESQEDKAAKKQKLDEKVAKLKRHLQIVPNNEDDVYTEATPLARKVLVVDYEIYTENNKPYYKIIRAD
nr:hypothetical protein [Tanacetum cinerariifolium]